ncbi:MAG TPA: EAL domain-containing protein, partial [Phormidium sp.]
VRAIVMLANNLGMQVVAEGIETPAQMQLLSALQCEYGQGYYFSKPIDSETAGALISAVPPANFGR